MDQRISEPQRPRRFMRYGVIAVAIVLCGGIAIKVLGSRAADAKISALKNAAPPIVELLPSDVTKAQEEILQHSIAITGTLQALNQTEIRSQQAGEIIEVMVREGDSVRRGQVLAKMDSTTLAARLQDKLGALEVGQAQGELAQRNVAKNAALLKENFISQAAFDNLRNSNQVSEATLVSLRAQVEQARKALSEAVIRAPIDGVVAERVAQPGMAVSDKTKIFTVQDLSVMNVEAPIPASEIPEIQVGQEATLKIEGFDDRAFVGVVERINPSTEKNSRSIIVHLRVENADRQLRGGMFVQGALGVAKEASVVMLPPSALRQHAGKTVVLLIADGKVLEQAVETGRIDSATGRVEIRSGVTPGNEVVLGNTIRLTHGQAVRVASPSAPRS